MIIDLTEYMKPCGQLYNSRIVTWLIINDALIEVDDFTSAHRQPALRV